MCRILTKEEELELEAFWNRLQDEECEECEDYEETEEQEALAFGFVRARSKPPMTKEEIELEMKEFWSYLEDPEYTEGWHDCSEEEDLL